MFGFIHVQRLALATCLALSFGSASAADLDPKAISIKLPDDIKWVANPSGSESAVLVGDPSKPGLYVVLQMESASQQQAAFASERPLHHCDFRYLVGRHRQRLQPG